MMETSRKAGLRLTLAALTLLLLHVGLVLREYPLRFPKHKELPLRGDVYRYYATTYGASQVGGLYGYDPYFMAGYPVGLWNSIGKKGFEMAHLLLPSVPLPALFYWTLILAAIAGPLVAWAALRPFCGSRVFSVGMLGLWLLYWHLDTQIAYFWRFGNAFFTLSGCLSIAAGALTWRIFVPTERSKSLIRDGLGLGLILSVILYVHPVMLVAAAFLLGMIAVTHLPAFRVSRTWLALAVALAVSVALCGWWLVPLWKSRAECVPQPHAWMQTSWRYLIMDALSDRVYLHHFDRNLLLRVAVLCGAVGAWRARRETPFLSVLACAGSACLVLTYGGSKLTYTASLQPYRFLIPATLLLIAPAAVGLQWALSVARTGDSRARALIGLLLLLIAPALTGYALDLTWRRPEIGLAKADKHALRTIAALPVRGRVLCDDASLAYLIPSHTGFPVIGGLSRQAFLRHRFAGFDNTGRLFERPAADWSGQTIRPYLDLYAVEYAVFSARDWIAFAEREPAVFELVQSVDSRRIYRVRNARPSLVLKGDAEVRATYSGIEVSNARSAVLLLKLHHANWLQTSAGVKLEKEWVLNDPTPFILATVSPHVAQFRIWKSSGGTWNLKNNCASPRNKARGIHDADPQ